MRRYDAIKELIKIIPESIPIVATIGDTCKELHHIANRATNLYMLGSFGLASSIGFGIALSYRGKVVVLEGDGGILMNMGSLSTIGRYGKGNLVLVIFDNGTYGSTGHQRTATSFNCNIADVAKSCGIKRVKTLDSLSSFVNALKETLKQDGDSVLLLKVSTENPDIPIINMKAHDIRERFIRSIKQ